MGAAGAAVTAVGSWLECRDQMVFAIADEIGTTHAFEGFAERGPSIGVANASDDDFSRRLGLHRAPG